MARKKTPPTHVDYLRALQRIFDIQSEVLTAALPHAGERGRNDEERFRELLRRILPRRFSIGTGFVRCADKSVPGSSQTDIVIYDEFLNSPLHRELAAFVYPVEIVFAGIEVKGLLRHIDIRKALSDFAKLRELATHKTYSQYVGVPVKPGSGNLVAQRQDVSVVLSPRTYVVAYDVKGWTTLEAFANTWEEQLLKNRRAHVHGVLVLARDWFFTQHAFTGEKVVLSKHDDNALARFLTKLLDDISSFEMLPAALHRYLDLPS
jgi:hypothetical protein